MYKSKIFILSLGFFITTCGLFADKSTFCLLVVNNGKIEGSNLERYLHSRKVSYFVVDTTSDFADAMRHTYKGVLLTGGPLRYGLHNVPIEKVNINFAAILNLDCPILGICFGHQTIVELFGGKIGVLKELSDGPQKVKILQKAVIFEGLPDEPEFGQNHYDCSTKIPYNFDIIATSDICPVESIKHKTRPIFGVQFHPESSEKYGYKVLDNFLKFCKCQFSQN